MFSVSWAYVEVSGELVSKHEEFNWSQWIWRSVNSSISLGGASNPLELFLSWGNVVSSFEFSEGCFTFSSADLTIMVGVNGIESLSGIINRNAENSAKVEVRSNSVGKSSEFLFVQWAGWSSLSGVMGSLWNIEVISSSDPSSSGSKFLFVDLTVVVGVNLLEQSLRKLGINTSSSSLGSDLDGRGGSNEGSGGKFHL